MADARHITSDDSKLIFSFEYPIANYSSSVTQDVWYTTPLCVVNDLPLKLWIKKVNSNDEKGITKDSLAFYLQLEKQINSSKTKLPNFKFNSLVRLTLVSQKLGEQDYSREFSHSFSQDTTFVGTFEFIDWKYFVECKEQFVKHDLIRVQAHIEVDTSQIVGTTDDIDPPIPDNSDDWLNSFEGKLNDMIIRRISEEFKELNTTLKEKHNFVKLLMADANSIIKEQAYPENFEDHLEEVVDQVFYSVSSEMSQFRLKLEKINADRKLTVDPICDKIHSIEEKVEKSCANYLSVAEELKRLRLEEMENCGKKEENKGDGIENDAVEMGKEQKSPTLDGEGEPIMVSVMKMVINMKNNIKKQLSFIRQQQSARMPNYYSSNSSHRGFHPPHREYDNPLMDRFLSSRPECCSHSIISCDQFKYGAENNARETSKGKLSTTSCTNIPHNSCNKTEKNDELSGRSSIGVGGSSTMTVSKFTDFPSEEEVLSKNLDINQPLKVKLLFIGTLNDGELVTHTVTSLKEFYALKRTYCRFEILE